MLSLRSYCKPGCDKLGAARLGKAGERGEKMERQMAEQLGLTGEKNGRHGNILYAVIDNTPF